jgi:hypothetical protein
MLDLSMWAEACFDDVKPCVLNVPILDDMLVPKSHKEWDMLYSVKGRGRDKNSISDKKVNLKNFHIDPPPPAQN